MEWHVEDEVLTSAGRVQTGNSGNGPPVILAHGWPWSSYSWYKLIPKLAKWYKVYWYDMLGYGRSTMCDSQRTSLDVQGLIFKEMVDYWEIKRPIVIAHDFGGATTLRAHLLHGCDFAQYILMNVVALRPWGSDFFDHVGKHIDAFTGLPPHIHEAVVKSYIQGALVNHIDDNEVNVLASPWLSAEGRISFYRQFEQADELYTAEFEPLLDRIRCPVSILWGEDDPWIPITTGQKLSKLIPQSSFHSLKKVGHLPQLENPKLVLNALVDRIGTTAS